MRNRWSKWTIVVLLIGAGAFIGLGASNPELLDYQKEVLAPVAQERPSASDAMLTSILQSISIPSSSPGQSEPAPSVLTVLTDRTRRANYGMFSVYSTEFEYCDGNSAVRTVGRSLGIAGKFYILDKGECRNQHNG
jgi:Domain of unknown function (DUF4359)